LVELVSKIYPLDHSVILYQAKVLPIDTMRNDTIKLRDFIDAEVFMHTTMVIPPCEKMQPNQQVLDRLAEIDLQQDRIKKAPKLTVVC